MKQQLRRLLPKWSLETYHLIRRTRSVAPVRLSTVTFLTQSVSDYARRRSRPLPIETPDVGRFFVRPYSSDLAMISTLSGPQGEYEAARVMLHDVRTIIDAGTNIGFTLRLWLKWFPDARIVAVEPDAENFDLARRNAEIMDASRITLLNKAVSDQPGTLYLDRACPAWAFHTVTDARPGTVAVEAVTVPDLMATLGDGPIDLFKCDIEGAEQALFKSCAGWIGRVRNMVVETHEPYSLEQLEADLKAAGSPLKLVRRISEAKAQSVGLFMTPANF